MSSVKVGAIIQARMASTRLPGKVLMPLPLGGEHTILDHVVRRARHAEGVDEVIVATSTESADDAIAEAPHGAQLFRGSEHDVLARFHGAAQAHGLDHVIRLTADNPLVDVALLGETLAHHLASGADYTRTTGLPLGMNFEILTREALVTSHERGTTESEREHVTVFIKHRPDEFTISTVAHERLAEARMTVDYPSDYAALHLVFGQCLAADPEFGLDALEALVAAHPWVPVINRDNAQVQV